MFKLKNFLQSKSFNTTSSYTSSSNQSQTISHFKRSLVEFNEMNCIARHNLNRINIHSKEMNKYQSDKLNNNEFDHTEFNHDELDHDEISGTDSQFHDDQFYIPIEGWETIEKRTKFTVYKLKVENLRTGLFWFVYRRFTDFERLNNKLKSKFTDFNDLDLPNKHFFKNSFNPIFIERRQSGLQLYLNRLMSNKKLLNELSVRRFLCIDEPPISNLADAYTYQSSVYSESDQLFICNNCGLLERKLIQMQLILKTKDSQIQKLQNALDRIETKNLI